MSEPYGDDSPFDVTEADRERIRVDVQSQRGRWLVAIEGGAVFRWSSLSRARRHAKSHNDVGIRAVVRRWRRDRVTFDSDDFTYYWIRRDRPAL